MSETPTLSEVINIGVDAKLFDLHTCLPGIVQKYDKAKNTVDVLPALKRKYESGELVNLPMVLNIPVAFPRGGKFSITHPIKAGDSVILVFAERSLDVWKNQGGVVDPQDNRKFNLTDAFAIPGGYPSTKPIAGASDTKLRILNDTALIEMGEDAKIKIQKVGGEDLLKLLDETLDAILAARTMTVMGPQPFLNLATFALLKTRLSTIKGEL